MGKRVQKVVPKLMAFSLSPQYFYRRGNHYWFCFSYPVTLRQHMGTSELRFSLQTTSKDSARYCASAIALKLKKVLKRMNNTTPPLTHDQIKRLARDWLHDSIRDAERFYAELPAMDENEWTERHDTLSELKGEAQEHAGLNRTERYARVADSILKAEGVTLTGADYSVLKRELAKAHAELMEAHLELLSGADASALKEADKQVPLSPTPVAGATPDAKPSPLLSEVVRKYVDIKKERDWTERTAMQQEHGLQLMLKIVDDMPISQLSRDNMRHYQTTIAKLPANMSKLSVCKGKDVSQILALGLPPMAGQTAKQSLERVSTFLKWARQEEYIEKNPADGIVLKIKSKTQGGTSTLPLDAPDLLKLFGSDRYRKGKFRESWHYWLPLMGLYTGARLGEMAQLRLEDVIQEDGVWLLSVTEDEDPSAVDARTVKTAAAIRHIPIHSALIKLGFLDYVEAVKQTGASKLFPSLKKGADGWSGIPSKWFSRYRKEEGVTESGKKFHSFRHSVVTRLMQNPDIPKEHTQILVGHDRNDVTSKVYFHGLDAARLQEIVETLQWPLDLDALAYNWKQCKL